MNYSWWHWESLKKGEKLDKCIITLNLPVYCKALKTIKRQFCSSKPSSWTTVKTFFSFEQLYFFSFLTSIQSVTAAVQSCDTVTLTWRFKCALLIKLDALWSLKYDFGNDHNCCFHYGKSGNKTNLMNSSFSLFPVVYIIRTSLYFECFVEVMTEFSFRTNQQLKSFNVLHHFCVYVN